MRKALVFSCFLAAALTANAQDGWRRFGAETGARRDTTEEAFRQRHLENLRLGVMEQYLRDAQERDTARRLLTQHWQDIFGFDAERAQAIAGAFNPDDIGPLPAMRLALRESTPEQAGADIRAALGAHDYHKANLLLIAAVLVANEKYPGAQP